MNIQEKITEKAIAIDGLLDDLSIEIENELAEKEKELDFTKKELERCKYLKENWKELAYHQEETINKLRRML